MMSYRNSYRPISVIDFNDLVSPRQYICLSNNAESLKIREDHFNGFKILVPPFFFLFFLIH